MRVRKLLGNVQFEIARHFAHLITALTFPFHQAVFDNTVCIGQKSDNISVSPMDFKPSCNTSIWNQTLGLGTHTWKVFTTHNYGPLL